MTSSKRKEGIKEAGESDHNDETEEKRKFAKFVIEQSERDRQRDLQSDDPKRREARQVAIAGAAYARRMLKKLNEKKETK